MKEIIQNDIFFILLTVGIYIFSQYFAKRIKFSLFHPVLMVLVPLIIFLKVAGISFSTYKEGVKLIDFMLAPSVVIIGFFLYENYHYIRKHFIPIFLTMFFGAFVGVLSVLCLALMMGAKKEIIASLIPKSVTSPIAIEISSSLGGLSSLAVVVVIIVGIFGASFGPSLLKKIKVEDKIAKGLAMGGASHALGTATALEIGEVEGAFAGLAIGLMGIFTAIWAPILFYLFFP